MVPLSGSLLFLEFPAAFSVGLKQTTTAMATRNVTKQKVLMSSTMATRVRFNLCIITGRFGFMFVEKSVREITRLS